MNEEKLTLTKLVKFKQYLLADEKSSATIEKYLRDVGVFLEFAGEGEITKELVLSFKQSLIANGSYKVGSINSILSSIRSFLRFINRQECNVKAIKTQHQIFCTKEQELTKDDYRRLIEATKGKKRLSLILQTICSTGIRVSELKYFTVETVRRGSISVNCKNKTRSILIPGKLKKVILQFCKERGISSGVVFRTKTGKPIDRSNIWTMMKKLSKYANVATTKVFPHNLRKLFARTFYQAKHDISTLADVLGHTNINTTRIYIMTTLHEHQSEIDKLDLVMETS